MTPKEKEIKKMNKEEAKIYVESTFVDFENIRELALKDILKRGANER